MKEVLRERPAEKRSFDYTNESKDQPGWMDKRKNIETDDAEWKKKSLTLRKHHECTHYFTKQVYGISENILHDEVMADFIGMYETFG